MEIYLHVLVPEAAYLTEHEAIVRETLCVTPGVKCIARASDAECVLVLPSFNGKFRRYAELLRRDPVIVSEFDRVLVYEGCDGPVGHLAGLYVNMPASRLDVGRMRSMPYLRPSSFAAREAGDATPTLLYSFRGAPSHPIRRQFSELLGHDQRGRITLLDRWMNYSTTETRAYHAELLGSAFVLCPRGLGPASIRLQETLEAGRVPVIISDEWAAPEGPDWDKISVRVRENDVAELPFRLRELEGAVAEMGAHARLTWEQFFAPGPAFGTWMVAKLADLQAGRDPAHTFDAASAWWESRDFKQAAGYRLLQRARERARRMM